jgi:aconitate decarboxylase
MIMQTDMQELPITRILSDYVSELSWNELGSEVIQHLKYCLLDSIGCGLFCSRLPWGSLTIEFGRSLGQGEEAGIWGTPWKVPAHQAALVNGTLIHSFEIDDLHKVAVIHPGAEVIPAVLAVAEKLGNVSGQDLLLAILAGYEVGCRVGVASGAIQLKRGFHPSATSGTIGAAAGVAKLLGLNGELTAHAMGIAGTQTAGLMSAQYQAMAKRMNPGKSAQSGVYAATLAGMGFTGITNVLEAGYGGFFTTFADAVEPADAIQGLGQQFETMNVGFKPYSCCGSNHTSVDAVLALKRKFPQFTTDNIEAITVHSTTSTKLHVGWDYVPSGMTGAQMNLTYAIAVALLDGDCFVDQYREERLADPEILSIIAKSKVIPDPELDRLGREGRHAIRMEIKLKDGTMLTEERKHAKGSAHQPITYDEVTDKFRKLVGARFGKGKAKILLSEVMNLEHVDNISHFTQLLAVEHN